MKNIKRQAICILAMLTMVFTLASCGVSSDISDAGDKGDKEKFLGTWKSTADLAEGINEDLREGLTGDGEGLADYLQISSFEVTLVYTFNEDDTYSVSVDTDALTAAIDHTKDEFKDGAVAYIEDVIAQSGRDMTVEEVLENSGLDLDAMADSALDYNKISTSFTDAIDCEGKWKAENGELYLSKSEDEEADDLSELYEITSDGIRLTETEGSEDEMGIYPLLLKKD